MVLTPEESEIIEAHIEKHNIKCLVCSLQPLVVLDSITVTTLIDHDEHPYKVYQNYGNPLVTLTCPNCFSVTFLSARLLKLTRFSLRPGLDII